MKPIFATSTQYGCYRVTYGHDARLYHHGVHGRITIDAATITLQYQRPILHERILQSVAPAWFRFFIFAYLGIFPLLRMMAVTEPYSFIAISLPLVIAFLLFIPQFTQHARIDKAMLIDCRRIGDHRLWLVGVDAHTRTLAFFLDLREASAADAAWQALTTPNGALAMPTAFSFATERLARRLEPGDSGNMVGEGSVRITPEEIILHGTESIPDPVAARRSSQPFKLAVITWFLLFASGLALDEWGLAGTGIVVTFVILGLIIMIFFGLRCLPRICQQRIIRPAETHIPLNKIRSVSLATDSLTLCYVAKGGGRSSHKLYIPPAVQDEMARLLAHPDDITAPHEFTVSCTPAATYDYYGGFFGRGMLTIDGDEVVFSGRRWDSEPHGRALWVPTLVVYALLVYFMNGLYPLLLGGVLPEDMKLLVILAIPLTFQLLGQYFIIGILPLFIRRTDRVPVDAISDVQHIGCQLSLTLSTSTDEPTRLTFHTRTISEAEAIASALQRR